MSVEEFLKQAEQAGVPPMTGKRCIERRLGSTKQMCDLLLGLVLAEEKTCTYSLQQFVEEEGGVPRAGDRIVFLDADRVPRCLVVLDDSEQLPFNQVSERHTAGEGPAAREVEVWRNIHRAYWSNWLVPRGLSFAEDIPVVWQSFRLLYPREVASSTT